MELLKPAAKRTLSALLKALPQNGVGLLVTRDTWHPLSGRHWEITGIRPKKKSDELLDAFGYYYFKGERTHKEPKKIASVWKHGWYCKSESILNEPMQHAKVPTLQEKT